MPIASLLKPGRYMRMESPGVDPITGPFYWDDFIGGTVTSGQVGDLGWVFAGAGITVQRFSGNSKNPGKYSIISAVGSGTWVSLYLTGAQVDMAGMQLQEIDFITNWFMGEINSQGRIGLWGPLGTTYIWFDILAGETTWHAHLRENTLGLESRIDTNVSTSPDVNTFSKYSIIASSLSYAFLINDIPVASIPIPATSILSLYPYIAVQAPAGGALGEEVYMDLFKMSCKNLRRY